MFMVSSVRLVLRGKDSILLTINLLRLRMGSSGRFNCAVCTGVFRTWVLSLSLYMKQIDVSACPHTVIYQL